MINNLRITGKRKKTHKQREIYEYELNKISIDVTNNSEIREALKEIVISADPKSKRSSYNESKKLVESLIYNTIDAHYKDTGQRPGEEIVVESSTL